MGSIGVACQSVFVRFQLFNISEEDKDTFLEEVFYTVYTVSL